MARAIWNGAISFGLVNVPVKLYSSTDVKDVHFHQLQKGTGKRVHNKRVAEGSDEEVAYEDIEKGFELDSGDYVVITADELDAAAPTKTRTIDIEDFVDLAEIDPMYFDKTYYLGPAGDAGVAKPYELLRRTMEDAGRIAIGRFVMRSKEYLAAIRPARGVLVLETMYFPDEIREPDVIGERPSGVRLNAREREMAQSLLDSLTSEWDPARYHDSYREQLLDVIKAKSKGETISVEEPEKVDNVVDLMAALEASVQAAKDKRQGKASGKGSGKVKTGSKRGGQAGSTGKKAAATIDLADRSREELYELATEQNIAGRSKMSKEELAAALVKQAS